jgi:hypothetical protein
VTLAGCGNPHKDELERNRNFDCRDRTVSYMAVGGLVAAELGLMMDCRDAGPRIVRWTVDKNGVRDETSHSLSVTEFDRTWDKIDGTGWLYLKDCEGTGEDGDPIYNFEVVDWNGTASFACQNSGPMPYPYHVLVDQLDMLAAQYAPTDASTRKGPDDP